MVKALNEALRDSLAEDDRAIVLGEDVGKLGGVFRVTDGLQDEFGTDRVFDTPLAESAIVGVSVGLCMAGWHPISEMQFDGFSYPALDQVISHVAKYRYRSRGRQPMPLVIRIPYAGGYGGAEHHNDSPETYYAHTAGLKVVTPSTPVDAYHLLRAAIADPDPVVFFEPKSRRILVEDAELLLGLLRHVVPAQLAGPAETDDERHGQSAAAQAALVAAAVDLGLEAHPRLTQVLDLRSLVPLDLEALATSVRKTGHAVVVHEAPMTAGFGAEVAARIMEDAFDFLEAPVLRVTGYDTPYPPATIEAHYLPNAERILAAVDRVINY